MKPIILFSSVALMSFYVISRGVLTQVQSYHQFADDRFMGFIPHAMNVLSNLGFLIVGILGMREVLKQKELLTRKAWFWFFLSVFLIAPGSAFYHASPNDYTLIWDRLPMSMGFMAMYIALLSELIDPKFEKFLSLALLLGILSVAVWVITGDLRFYFLVQFGSFVTIPLILLMYSSRFTMKSFYFLALGFYGLAKVTEIKDHEIYELTQGFVSGHTLKHLLATAGLFLLWLMIRFRKETTR